MKKLNEFIDKIKEMRKDKKGRAKLELSLYAILAIVLVLFIRLGNYGKSYNEPINTPEEKSFIYTIKDNYEYNISIKYNNESYTYNGRVLGNNAKVKKISDNDEEYYYVMNNKYYELDDDGNYILTSRDDIYNNIDYKYLNINDIKNFIEYSTKENNTYKIKLSDIILNNNSEDYITINIDEESKILTIDYTNLFKLDNENINNVIVTITYSNIDNIISLEE